MPSSALAAPSPAGPPRAATSRRWTSPAATRAAMTFRSIQSSWLPDATASSVRRREQLCLTIRKLRPGLVVTHDPWRLYQRHPDHPATGMGTVDAVMAARDH